MTPLEEFQNLGLQIKEAKDALVHMLASTGPNTDTVKQAFEISRLERKALHIWFRTPPGMEFKKAIQEHAKANVK